MNFIGAKVEVRPINNIKYHPLLNHLILQNVFDFLRQCDLKNARLVCQIWNKAASGRLQDISHVHLNLKELSNYLELVHLNNVIAPRNQIENKYHFHNKKFHFQGFRLNYQTHPLLSSFLINCGENVKEAVFSKCTFPKNFLRAFAFLPNLEIVSFCNSVLSDDKLEDVCSVLDLVSCPKVQQLEVVAGQKGKLASWADIFSAFPKIKSLQVQLQRSADLTELLTILRQSKPVISITEFCSYIQLDQNHVDFLIQIAKNLKNIDIIVCHSVTEDQLANLLTTCSRTLKCLKLSHGEKGDTSPSVNCDQDWEHDQDEAEKVLSYFPYNIHLQNLTSLEINNGMMNTCNFLQFLPNLKNLFVLHDDAEEDEITNSKLIQNTPSGNTPSKLESLTMQYALSPACIQKLGDKLCPKIKKLSVYLDDDSIRSVYLYLPNLEELWVFGTEVTDEGITGIPVSILCRSEIRGKEGHREFPYIGQSQKLRKFGLYAQPQENISDDSVHYGLMDVKELTSLDLPQTAITDDGIRILMAKSNLVYLSARFFVDDGELIKRSVEFQIL